MKKDLGVLENKFTISKQCAPVAEAGGVHEEKYDQQTEGDSLPSLLCPSEATPELPTSRETENYCRKSSGG